MFFNSAFKKIFLSALLCIAPSINMQAGWFSTLWNMAQNTYPTNMFAKTREAVEEITKTMRHVPDNDLVEHRYPYACAHTYLWLRNVGIDPKKIDLYNQVIQHNQAWGWTRHNTLALPLGDMERLLAKKNVNKSLSPRETREYNTFEGVTAHECGHLKNKSALAHALAPSVAVMCTELCASLAQYFVSIPPVVSPILKEGLTTALIKIWDHIDEYRADSFAIRHCTDPQAFIDAAAIAMEMQYSAQQALEQKKQKSLLLSIKQSPIFWTICHWIYDTHGSLVARANRLLKQADIKVSQTELLQELTRQVTIYEQCKKRRFLSKPNFNFNMAPILAASEKNKKLAAERAARVREWDELLTLGGYPE